MIQNPHGKQVITCKVNKVRIGDAGDVVVSQHTLTWLKPARKVCDRVVRLDFSEYFIDGVGVRLSRWDLMPDVFFPDGDPDHAYQLAK